MQAHQRGDVDAAERDYRAALAAVPSHPVALHFLGVVHFQRDRVADALPLLERAVAIQSPRSRSSTTTLGWHSSAADSTDEAFAQFSQALARKPDLATAWNNLGLAQQAANRLPDAIAAFREALRAAARFCARRTGTCRLRCLPPVSTPKAGANTNGDIARQTFGAAVTSSAPRWQR